VSSLDAEHCLYRSAYTQNTVVRAI
jgi:hypothetical protein